jgi:hypothetical protein
VKIKKNKKEETIESVEDGTTMIATTVLVVRLVQIFCKRLVNCPHDFGGFDMDTSENSSIVF